MEYRGRHVIVTGGIGPGTAVVGAFLEAGAICHAPYRNDEEYNRFPYRDDKRVLMTQFNVTNESNVRSLYARLETLWVSIHIAGGFAFKRLRKKTS
jgi:NAD(P)-dependent dehydrogenase (short-subunit alcohol dehydrogenase family)